MPLFISNPSRGGAAPSAAGDPSGVKAIDPIRVSLRNPTSAVNLGSLQMGVGFAQTHALGSAGRYDQKLPRTRLGSLLSNQLTGVPTCVTNPTFGQLITKTSSSPQASVFFTSVDRADGHSKNAMFSTVMQPGVTAITHIGDPDPFRSVIGLENGPANSAVYCTFLNDFDESNKVVRICGPSVSGVRSPDIWYPCPWSSNVHQYIIFWNDSRGQVELWLDLNTSGIGTAQLIAAIPISEFNTFGAVGTVPAGGANDITAIYGLEGPSSNFAAFVSMALATNVSFPFISGARAGGWRSYLDSDITMSFSGAVDPTRLSRGGAWFIKPSGDPLGTLSVIKAPAACRLLKKTPSTAYSIYRDEPGFAMTATDGLMVEFEINTQTSGGTGFETGAALQISDGSTLFQLDFFSNGSTFDLGLLLRGGDPGLPSDHLQAAQPIDYRFRRLRLVIDPRRGVIDLYDTLDLLTPLISWTLERGNLPTTASTNLVMGLPVSATAATGFMDIFSFKYSYIYQAWEVRDSLGPTSADPPYTSSDTGGSGGPLNLSVMPGIGFFPLPYEPPSGGGGGSPGSGSLQADGFQIATTGGEVLTYTRVGLFDANRGAVIEAAFKITKWHPAKRTSVFVVLDDSLKAYMLSFVETDTGKYVCIPMSSGSNGFAEFPSNGKISAKVDWSQVHTYRLERRPRDGVYLYIDNAPDPALVLLDSARYSFPTTQFHAKTIGFGHLTDEGATSVWKFARDCFGTGYEISAQVADDESDLRAKLSNARATVVVSAGE